MLFCFDEKGFQLSLVVLVTSPSGNSSCISEAARKMLFTTGLLYENFNELKMTHSCSPLLKRQCV